MQTDYVQRFLFENLDVRGLGRGEVVIRNEMCNHEYRFDRAAVETLFA